jgi:hypothetical protein
METLVTIPWYVWLLVPVALYIVGPPLLILATFRHEAHPCVKTVDLEQLPLPSEIQTDFDAVQAELAEDGFVPMGTFLLPSQMPNTRAVFRVFVNRAERVSAMAAWFFAIVDDRVTRHSHHVEFTTRYASGQVFNTLNTKEISVWGKLHNTVTVRVPWITNVRRLYQLHQAITSVKGPAEAKLFDLDTVYGGDSAAYVAGSMREELQHAADAGYLRLDATGSYFVATIPGAYFMTWKQLPPFKQLVALSQRRKAEQLLAEIGPTAAADLSGR